MKDKTGKLGGIEAILLGMIHEPAQQRMGDVAAENLFAVERTPGFQDPKNFANCLAPPYHVVDRPEVDNRVVGRVGHRNMPEVAYPQPCSAPPDSLSLANKRNHLRV